LRLPPRAEALTAALGTAGHPREVQGLRPCTPHKPINNNLPAQKTG